TCPGTSCAAEVRRGLPTGSSGPRRRGRRRPSTVPLRGRGPRCGTPSPGWDHGCRNGSTRRSLVSGSVRRVAVVGAGMVGLATAWFLRERGVEVTVLDRKGVAAGASWGNAGWLTPAIATPLPEPAVLRYGMRAVLSANSPVYVPPTLD